jgi:type IV pilus assembly protein PilB
MSEMTTFFQSKKLEDILVEMRLMKKEDIAALVVECQTRRKSLLEVILEKKLLDETSVYKALAIQSNLEFMDLKNYEAPRLLFSILPINLLKMQNLVPVKKEGNILTIATSDPSSFFSVQSIRMVTGLNIKLVVSQKNEIIRIKTKIIDETTQAKSQIPERGAGLFGGPAGPAEKKTAIKSVNISEVIDDLNLEFVSSSPEQVNLEEALIESRQKPVMAFVNKTILEAVKKQASDIHFERMENNCRII